MEKIESMSYANEEQPAKKNKLTVMETALALLSTTIGGGILGFPYAFSRMGVTLGIISTITMAIIAHFSSMMYLKTKDLMPRRYESIYEIAYLLFGRPSIFVVCTILMVGNYGAIVLYYMIIGETLSTLTT